MAQGVGVSEVVGELEEQKVAVSLVLTEAEMDALAVTLEERHSVAVPLLEEEEDRVTLADAEPETVLHSVELVEWLGVTDGEAEEEGIPDGVSVTLSHPLVVALMDGLPLNDSVPLCDCEGLPEKVEESVADAHSETVLVVDTHCDTVRVLLWHSEG